MKPRPDTPPLAAVEPPFLLTARSAAALCGTSLRTWRRWDAAGFIPSPVRVGRSTLWRKDEVCAWIATQCPRRREWEARKTGRNSPGSA